VVILNLLKEQYLLRMLESGNMLMGASLNIRTALLKEEYKDLILEAVLLKLEKNILI
jgi:hypothetical protein